MASCLLLEAKGTNYVKKNVRDTMLAEHHAKQARMGVRNGSSACFEKKNFKNLLFRTP